MAEADNDVSRPSLGARCMTPAHMLEQVRAAARAYLALGWCPIPVAFQDKAPLDRDWQNLRLTAEDIPRYFARPGNVGVLLGEPSSHLTDVDLDCAEAIELAPKFLPRTWTFGHGAKARSHWLYIAEGAAFEKFLAAEKPSGRGATLVELRGRKKDGHGCAGQTVFPPSVHESGEPIVGDEDGDALEEPTRVDANKLRTRVAKLAAACLAMRYAGREATEAWLDGGDCPALPPEATMRIRQWWGLHCEPTATTRTRALASGGLDVVERARRYLARVPPAISGSGGHPRTLLATEHLVRGFGLDDAIAFELLATDYSPRCEPPWSERELQHKVREAGNKGTTVAWGQHLRDERRHG